MGRPRGRTDRVTVRGDDREPLLSSLLAAGAGRPLARVHDLTSLPYSLPTTLKRGPVPSSNVREAQRAARPSIARKPSDPPSVDHGQPDCGRPPGTCARHGSLRRPSPSRVSQMQLGRQHGKAADRLCVSLVPAGPSFGLQNLVRVGQSPRHVPPRPALSLRQPARDRAALHSTAPSPCCPIADMAPCRAFLLSASGRASLLALGEQLLHRVHRSVLQPLELPGAFCLGR